MNVRGCPECAGLGQVGPNGQGTDDPTAASCPICRGACWVTIEPAPLGDQLDRLRGFEELEDGWDSYAAKAPLKSELVVARQFVASLDGVVAGIDCQPMIDGGVAISVAWRDRMVEVEIVDAEREPPALTGGKS